MRSLIIECATEACSVALFDGDVRLQGTCEVIGRGHAERLVPMIADLPGKGLADRIVVSLGPGSFTGVRIGLAAARALGLAWNVPVVGYPTLALVAAMARGGAATPVTVCMTGGHGEWFMQDFSADGEPENDLASVATATATPRHALVAGSQAEALVARAGTGNALPRLPDANAFALLGAGHLRTELSPLYGRPPDAKLPVAKTAA
jgi:tRNA threonylcarbamoyl adenosine modification protein YeaZ